MVAIKISESTDDEYPIEITLLSISLLPLDRKYEYFNKVHAFMSKNAIPYKVQLTGIIAISFVVKNNDDAMKFKLGFV